MKPIIRNYNEESLGKAYFELSDPKVVRTALEITFSNQTTQAILKLVARYLLHSNEQGKNAYELEDILRKYSIVLIYLFLKERSKKYDILGERCLGLRNDTFESILEGGITYEKIDKAHFLSENILTKLFNKDNEDNKTFNRDVKDFKKKLFALHYRKVVTNEGKEEQIISEKEVNAIINLLSKDALFFYSNRTNFIDIFSSSMRNLDMIIAEAKYESKFINFDIEIPKDQVPNYLENFSSKASKADCKERGTIIFGYMVDAYLSANDLELSNKATIIDASLLKFNERKKNIVTYKKGETSILNFVTSEMKVDKNKIVPFIFKFNNKEYRFSNKGLELI